MKYGDFKTAVTQMLLEEGEIHGTDAYRERLIRVSLLEAISFFPTLRPDKLVSVPAKEVVIDGYACIVPLASVLPIKEVRLVQSGWEFVTEEGEDLSATTNGSGGFATFDEAAVIVVTDPGTTGLELNTPYYVYDSGGWIISETDGGPPVSELGGDITYRIVKAVEPDPKYRLGPFEERQWIDRQDLVNGLVAACDLIYIPTPDRDNIIVHPIITFDKVLQITFENLGTNFTDESEINIPEEMEDRFVVACTDYVRARIAKDIERNANLSSFHTAEFKRGIRSIYKEIPR